MLHLHENENVVLVMRKHWFVVARILLLFAVLLLVPFLVLYLLPLFIQSEALEFFNPFIYFLLSLYMLLLLLFLFFSWMQYYLDIWVVTNDRVLDVTQNGLFNIEIAEIPIDHIQNITIEIQGLIETVLKFGAITIETAGERDFSMTEAPRLNEAKDVILKYTDAAKKKVAGAGS